MNTTELWDEVYKLRTRLINKAECPECEGYLLSEEVDGKTGYYRCCECNRVWVYYGGLVSEPED
jgi:hypothetical protein